MKSKKPLMLAYIIFLCICTIYHLFAKFLNWEFLMWEPILVGVTIASYFFSISSIYKSMINQEEQLITFLNEEKQKAIHIYEKEKELIDDEKRVELLKDNDFLEDTNKLISETEKTLSKNKRASFRFDVIGFLVFFCIITFPQINQYFAQLQETFTITAFIGVLLTEYAETIIAEKSEIRKKSLSLETEKLLATLNSIKTEKAK